MNPEETSITTWKINGNEYPSKGHLFTTKEVLYICSSSGFDLKELVYVDYDNGNFSRHQRDGQIIVHVTKK